MVYIKNLIITIIVEIQNHNYTKIVKKNKNYKSFYIFYKLDKFPRFVFLVYYNEIKCFF